MIAPRQDLPFIQFGDGEIAVFERDWLVRRLVNAAEKAGYPEWWLAEHVAESVTSYLRFRCEENVMPLPRFAQTVQAALQVIGYAEVGQHFDPGPPPIKVSLLELASRAGVGYELAFFALLGRTMDRALECRAGYLELFDLQRCVKKLRARKIWSRDCEALRTEIVSFSREHLTGANHDVVFTIL